MNVQLLSLNDSQRSTANLLLSLLPYGLMLLLIVGLPGSAWAQSDAPNSTGSLTPSAAKIEATPQKEFAIPSATWQSHVGEQMARVLREEESASIRSTMLRNVIAVATRGPNGIDLSATVDPLLQICKDDLSEQRRLMAIQALLAIGPEHAGDRLYHHAMNRLYRLMQSEPSQHVRQVAATLLDTYYTTGETTE